MTLFGKLVSYIHLRKLGVRNSWTSSPLLAIDYLLILFSVCVLLIAITLHYAEKIDNAFMQEKAKTSYVTNELDQTLEISERNARVADFNEQLVVSMLNGAIVVNGRVKTLCTLNSAGDCIQ